MPTSRVNLDALIWQADFDATKSDGSKPNQHSGTPEFRIDDFESGRAYSNLLRKPDFQRETADWDPKRVQELVHSFVHRDLIPSIILWQSESGNVFVIDGAHRLSALIAWVRDDYGDGQLSQNFFQNFIPPEQKGLLRGQEN